MKKVLLIITAAFLISGCKKDVQPEQENTPEPQRMADTHTVTEYDSSKPVDTLKGVYTTPLVLDNNKTWYLDGLVRIKGTTCTIKPGTIIAGLNPQTSNGANPGMLIIESDALINAEGTADEPVIFTSKFMVDGNPATIPAPGDFGGVVILGKSVTYRNSTIFYAPDKGLGEAPVELPVGGTNIEHSSGNLSFVRIEYAGFKFKTSNPAPAKPYYDIDGFACISVGHGTQINHIEVANSKTNSFRFTGGTVNTSYLADIDHTVHGFMVTGGYIGVFSYGISLAGNNQQANGVGILVGNRWNGDGGLADRPTHPIISNFTIAGIDRDVNTYPNLRAAIYVQSGPHSHGITLHRSILLGYNNALDDIKTLYEPPHIYNVATGNIFCNARSYSSRAAVDVYLASTGENKRHMSTINTNSFARLTQPFLRRGNVNLTPLSISPANEGSTSLAGAFTDYSRPPSRWGHTRNWFRLYY
jgi:hypothetical protein